MRFDWRVSAGAAGAALLLSLVTGLISGVPFVTVLARALVWAVLFGVGAVAVSYVVDRYLPDLKSAGMGDGSDSSGTSSTGSPDGNMVDIVIDDRMDEEGAPQELELDEVDDVEEIDTEETQGADEALEAEEVAELETPDDETGETEDGAAREGFGESGDASDAEAPGRLPDIEGLSDAFSDGHAGVEDGEDSGRSGEDPGVMARAIRTVLKREE